MRVVSKRPRGGKLVGTLKDAPPPPKPPKPITADDLSQVADQISNALKNNEPVVTPNDLNRLGRIISKALVVATTNNQGENIVPLLTELKTELHNFNNRKVTFTINRDSRGYMKTVEATVGRQ